MVGTILRCSLSYLSKSHGIHVRLRKCRKKLATPIRIRGHFMSKHNGLLKVHINDGSEEGNCRPYHRMWYIHVNFVLQSLLPESCITKGATNMISISSSCIK